MSGLLGIDCGGTNTKLLLAGVADKMHAVLARDVFATPRGPGAFAEIGARALALAGDHPLDGFGLAMPGIIDGGGTVVTSTNLPWAEGIAPVPALAGRLAVAGAIVNDGTATAQAEVALGAARGYEDAFILALGTGVAGAHVVGGEIRRGAHQAAGEIGHISFGGDLLCSCGQRGCLETLIGGRQLGLRWRQASGADHPVSARDLIEAAAAGDERARGLLDEATTGLSRSLLGLVALVDPGIIVIGGGIATAREQVIDPVIAKVRRAATFHQLPPIVPAALGMWGAAWGAALAAERLLEPSPADRSW